MKLNSPGFSLHLANLTQGWNTGSSITLLTFCRPDGVERFNTRSGTPEIFEVHAIVPLAKAANGLPEGASVTDSVSMRSIYSSFDVCRTFALRHGRAGVFAATPVEDIAAMLEFEDEEKPGFLEQVSMFQ
jgi:hypothetical protein